MMGKGEVDEADNGTCRVRGRVVPTVFIFEQPSEDVLCRLFDHLFTEHVRDSCT